MATNEPLQLNLGSLRSAMSLTLHTHHASRIWHGRAAAEGRPGIVGLNGYIAQMNKMRRGSEQDDPYSDWWMLRIEVKLDQTKTTLQSLREQVDQALASVPPALSLGENLNVQPVKLPLFVNAQLGFAAVYLLADYDDIARKLILAHHTALIDRSTLERWLNEAPMHCAACSRWPSNTAIRAVRATISCQRTPQHGRRWRNSANCPRTCWKARAARSSRRPSCAVA